MAPRAFLLLNLAFAVVLLINSEVVVATTLAENTNSESKAGGHGEHIIGGSIGRHDKGVKPGKGLYDPNNPGHKGCKLGCCTGKSYHIKGGCKCCKTFAEATAYKQTQN
ncbi:uncharacterized protein LOC111902832 [Lactuca sativa]|uniref:Glycine-rich protein n=1 Tax=Lactuca sativa TaxID=4236 RepID=A0A9R1X290_LACSA|nr:uncharacterized protein LOC111902832 [Lactuca sativa]KAJ0195469.1 hypothetical protein LSAT_V11C700379710 [Lactuca sativa]